MCAGAALYRRLKEYLMTEEQLKENGYPMPHPEKAGRAVLFTAEEKKVIDCKLCWLFPSAGFAGYSWSYLLWLCKSLRVELLLLL